MRTITKRTYFTLEDCGVDLNTVIEVNENNTKLVNLLNLRYKHNWISYTDTEIVDGWEDNTESEPNSLKVEQWKDRFKYLYETTSERYNKIIELYKAQEANLLAKIGSSTKTRFNDTPQNAGNYELDDYTTTVTQVGTEVDPGEMIDRLNNIHNKLKDLFSEWVEEFEPLFGENTLI